MKKPNFFIIGAPKCGTTSLAMWLSEHPNIYMSPIKEPHYFSSDLRIDPLTQDRHIYYKLFQRAGNEHKAVGEASANYLFSKVAVPRIEAELPNSKYIVMLRNPVEMAYALHEQQIYNGIEHIKDFAEAWRLSEERARGRYVSQRCSEPLLLAYHLQCRLGELMQRLLNTVPRERVLILLLDDLKENPRREYLRVLNFLGVPDDGRQDFPVYNPAKERRWIWLHQAVMIAARASSVVKRRVLRTPRGIGLLQALDRWNVVFRPRKSLDPEIRAELTKYFRKDIELLSELIGRDLSGWVTGSDSEREGSL